MNSQSSPTPPPSITLKLPRVKHVAALALLTVIFVLGWRIGRRTAGEDVPKGFTAETIRVIGAINAKLAQIDEVQRTLAFHLAAKPGQPLTIVTNDASGNPVPVKLPEVSPSTIPPSARPTSIHPDPKTVDVPKPPIVPKPQ